MSCGCFANNYYLLKFERDNQIKNFSTGKNITFHPSLTLGEVDISGYNKSNFKELLNKNSLFQLKPNETDLIKDINYGINLSVEYFDFKSFIIKTVNKYHDKF